MSIHRRTNQQNVIYPYSGILFNLKKDGNSDTCYIMDETWGHYAKWNKPDIKVHVLCESTFTKYLGQSDS